MENEKNALEEIAEVKEEERMVACAWCGEVIPESEAVEEIYGDYCKDCEEHIHICEGCGKHFDDRSEDYIYYNDEIYCDDCKNDKFIYCEDCGEWGWECDSYYIQNYGWVCDSCYDHGDYYCCDNCGDYFCKDDINWDEASNQYYCHSCYLEKDWNTVHEYGYKPEPIFHKCSDEIDHHLLYMGVELETDEGGQNDNNAKKICTVVNGESNEEYLYAKSDSSLDEGIEFVSHPMTLQYHRSKMDWQGVMRKAISLGYVSHNADTCGLHVHVSRNGLGETYVEQEATTARLIYFFEKFYDEIVRFSRRKSGELRWAQKFSKPMFTENIKDNEAVKPFYYACKDDYNRYRAVNIRNRDTVEFRIFKGTLKYNSFIATLEFVNEICEFCKTTSDEQFYNISFINAMRKFTEGGKNPELIQYLGERHFVLEEVTSTDEEPETNPTGVMEYKLIVRDGSIWGEDMPEDIRRRVKLKINDEILTADDLHLTRNKCGGDKDWEAENRSKRYRIVTLNISERNTLRIMFTCGYQKSFDYRDLTFVSRDVDSMDGTSVLIELYSTEEINGNGTDEIYESENEEI